jgi:5-methylcytosine-specific restriction enzyme subunit McrC
MIRVVTAKEHSLTQELAELNLSNLLASPAINRLRLEAAATTSQLQASYYVGADWLIEGEVACNIRPKIENLDFLKLFIDCFSHPDSAAALNAVRRDERLYEIFFEEPLIPVADASLCAPVLLIVHFVQVLQGIAKKGLQKGYVNLEAPLMGAVKGKVLVGKTIKSQLATQNISTTWCRYTEYTLNCRANRILKKALTFSNSYLVNTGMDIEGIRPTLGRCFSAFENVSDEIALRDVADLKLNHFYKEYGVAISLAKKILSLFGNSLEKATSQLSLTPPFYVNMALLFEIYVFSKLKKSQGKSISYQVRGVAETEVDFVDKDASMIIDTKYKSIYETSFNIDDIRQLSGYSRDKRIRQTFTSQQPDNQEPACLIIYPKAAGVQDLDGYQSKQPIEQFSNFYKLGIQLPIKSNFRAT